MKDIKNNKIQIVRALAVFAVILIHTCPAGSTQAYFRPFVNFAVATFLFLSGYLTKIENDNWFSFAKKRIIRVIIPYIIWTCIYSFVSFLVKGFDLKKLIFNLFTTKACGTLYYIFVYIQLVLLTPLLTKLAKSKYNWLGFIISPITVILFKYYWLISGNVLNKYISTLWGLVCFDWLIFYYFGILLGNKIINLRYNIKIIFISYLISIPLQMLEGYAWFVLGESNCGTQVKFTAFITNILFLILAYHFIITDKLKIKNKILVKIGDYSFGIYLSHMLIIQILNKIPLYSVLPYGFDSALVFGITFLCVICGHKILGKTVSKWVGLI